jgi:hypothetical protein
MTLRIDSDVALLAEHWGLPAALLQAVVAAEGNIVKAVQCSIPSVQTRAAALEVLCRSCVHAMSDFIYANDGSSFVEFWAARWAPTNVANDPTHLNQNWAHNVEALWGV